jgi:hypothetical protein
LGGRVSRGKPRDERRVEASDAERKMTEDAMMDFTIEELREFLQADLLDVPVDPRFKERLKRRLWELVQRQAKERESDD